MPGYFSKFPITSYKGTPSINILKRTGFNENVKDFLTSFYTYTIEEGYRIDSIAHDYYDDVNFDWLIYQTNDIVDPYYQVSLNQFEFEEFIKKKYGSVREATRKTALYRNNFEGDDSLISTSAYDSLPARQKKYYRPVSNAFNVVGYERSDEDFTATTNKIITLQLTASNDVFTIGEIVTDTEDLNTFAEVTWADEETVVLQHIRGSFDVNNSIRGETSSVVKQIDDELFVQNVIPEIEQVFYSPVSFYDLESEKNEQNREIFLVEKPQVSNIEQQLKKLLK